MSRGIRRSVICLDGKDYHVFMLIIQNTKEKFPFRLHSFCVMANHFHLLLTTEKVEIGRIMGHILGNYARYFNARYGYKGHLFEDRYTSSLIKTSVQLVETSRYIHLNPVKAGIVENPADFPHSSYKYYIKNNEHPLLDKNAILEWFDDSPQKYKNYVEKNKELLEPKSVELDLDGVDFDRIGEGI